MKEKSLIRNESDFDYYDGARGRTRTDMAVNRWILSPLRLPISPLGHGQNYIRMANFYKELFYKKNKENAIKN